MELILIGCGIALGLLILPIIVEIGFALIMLPVVIVEDMFNKWIHGRDE